MFQSTTDQRIVILGGGGTAVDFSEAALAAGNEVLGFLKDTAEEEPLPVLGILADWKRLPEDVKFFCGFGSVTSYKTRLEILARLGIPEHRYAVILHPQAVVSPSAFLGPGCGILACASLGARARLGAHVEVLQSALIAHDCCLEDGVIVAGGANLAGGIHIGRGAYVGAGACIRGGIRVGERALLGMNSTLLEDVPPGAVYVGSPAKPVHNQSIGIVSIADLKPLKITEPWFDEAEHRGVKEILASGQLVQSRCVEEFERLFAEETGMAHAVMVSSGTAALHLAMLACGIGPGDVVVVPDYTFVATANVVARTGATPVFVDVAPETYNMDVGALQALVERMVVRKRADGLRLRMIMPVHQFGLPAEMDEIAAIAKEYDLLLVEDAACALGSRYRGRRIGSWGAVSCFSFHPRKVITTGEGGAVVTNDARLAERVRALRAHGFATAQDASDLIERGLNYRMTEMQAALGITQMGKLSVILERRQRLAKSLTRDLADVTWFTPPRIPAHLTPNWQSYVGVLDEGVDRARIMEYLADRGIEARSGATAIHRLKSYREHPAPWQPICPVSEMLDARTLALPLHPKMADADVSRISAELRAIAL